MVRDVTRYPLVGRDKASSVPYPSLGALGLPAWRFFLGFSSAQGQRKGFLVGVLVGSLGAYGAFQQLWDREFVGMGLWYPKTIRNVPKKAVKGSYKANL